MAFWVAVVWGAANAISSLLIIAGVGVVVTVVLVVLARLIAWLVRELRRPPPPG